MSVRNTPAALAGFSPLLYCSLPTQTILWSCGIKPSSLVTMLSAILPNPKHTGKAWGAILPTHLARGTPHVTTTLSGFQPPAQNTTNTCALVAGQTKLQPSTQGLLWLMIGLNCFPVQTQGSKLLRKKQVLYILDKGDQHPLALSGVPHAEQACERPHGGEEALTAISCLLPCLQPGHRQTLVEERGPHQWAAADGTLAIAIALFLSTWLTTASTPRGEAGGKEVSAIISVSGLLIQLVLSLPSCIHACSTQRHPCTIRPSSTVCFKSWITSKF